MRETLTSIDETFAAVTAQSLRDVAPQTIARSEQYHRAQTIGGGGVGVANLGAGLLSATGFMDARSRLLLETTRFGLATSRWTPDPGILKQIAGFRANAAPTGNAAALQDCIYLATNWDSNFQHFIIETASRIFYIASAFPDAARLPIVVMDFPHTRELTSILFPGLAFVFIKPGDTLAVSGNCWFVMPVAPNLTEIPDLFTAFVPYFRQKHLEHPDAPEIRPSDEGLGRKIYFGRKVAPGNAGNARVMVNAETVHRMLAARGYDITYFDGLSTFEKMAEMAGARALVTPVGANVMNLLLAPSGAHVGLISHPSFHAADWMQKLMGLALGSQSRMVTFTAVEPAPDSQTHDRFNVPYVVKEAYFPEFLDRLDAQ